MIAKYGMTRVKGVFFKRSPTAVNVQIDTDNIGFVWIPKDKTSGIDWGALTSHDHVSFDLDDGVIAELKKKEADEESELQEHNEE